MAKKKIKTGDRVPSFSLKNQHGETLRSEQFLGRPFVLYFYPKDNTPVCTAEACHFRDTYEEFRGLEAEVVGVSADSPASHLAFAKKHGLPFVLLSDEKNELRKMFGVPGDLFGLLPGRATYVVDAEGIVRHVFDAQFGAKKHVEEALRGMEAKGKK